jgi:RNA methyltransferase, TrmH family
MSVLTSRDNPRVRRWRELTRDASERRKQRRAIIEGEHLVLAFLQSGRTVESLILSKTASSRSGLVALAKRSGKAPAVLADPVFRSIVDVETPAGIAAEIPIPPVAKDLKSAKACLFLDAIQDAGNVGTILRSAAAFGIGDAVLGKGCADAWSPKVLRAGMGAHFVMAIRENADLGVAIANFGGKVACTVPRSGVAPSEADLSGRIGWLLGAEGQGVSDVLAAAAQLRITIPMAGGMESLNVAAAAAICFYALSTCGARS